MIYGKPIWEYNTKLEIESNGLKTVKVTLELDSIEEKELLSLLNPTHQGVANQFQLHRFLRPFAYNYGIADNFTHDIFVSSSVLMNTRVQRIQFLIKEQRTVIYNNYSQYLNL